MELERVAFGGVAAENAQAPCFSGLDQTILDLADAREGRVCGSHQIDKEPFGDAAHGGDVGDGAGNGLSPDEAGGGVGGEVLMFDDRVGGEQEVLGGAGESQDSAIIAGTGHGSGLLGQAREQLAEELVFADIAESFH